MTLQPPLHHPGIPHRCMIRIRGIYHTIKSAERGAVDFILEEPGFLKDASISEFASRAGCSEATLVRLARKLGYGGFPEMKADFNNPDSPFPYAGVSPGDSPVKTAEKVFANSIQALTDTLDILDTEQYETALEALLEAKAMAFFGLGNASVVAREAYQKFLRLGIPCHFEEDPDLQLLILNSQLKPGDLVLLISYTGESKPILDIAKTARGKGLNVVALTNFPNSTLARAANINLQTAVFQEHLYGEVGSKRLAQLCLLESLYINFLARKPGVVGNRLAESNTILSQNKTHNYSINTEGD